MRSRTVIIGGSGFIGRGVTARLLSRGGEVFIIDPRPPADRRAAWIEADARDPEIVRRALQPGDALIHLFHSSIPADSIAGPDRETKDNVEPFARLFPVLAEQPPAVFAYSSTGGQIYGHARALPIAETAPADPITAYGRAKLAMEGLTRDQARKLNMPFLILRFGNPYGPYQELTNRHGVVPHLMRAVIHHTPFTAYGAEETVRDYIYIEDAAEAVVRLIAGGQFNQTVNIGTGLGTSLAELIALVEKITGGKIAAAHAPIRPFDIIRNALDIGRLQKLTGFTPAVSLEDGLARTWEYFKAHEKA